MPERMLGLDGCRMVRGVIVFRLAVDIRIVALDIEHMFRGTFAGLGRSL